MTDTTMRDAHQSLLATRMRTQDIAAARRAYAKGLPQFCRWNAGAAPLSMWRCGFLNEDPWERLALIREGVPNLLTQMLLRGANGVGYTNYPDNVVKEFVRRAAAAAWICSVSSIASTGSRICASPSTRCAKQASWPKGRSATPANVRSRPRQI